MGGKVISSSQITVQVVSVRRESGLMGFLFCGRGGGWTSSWLWANLMLPLAVSIKTFAFLMKSMPSMHGTIRLSTNITGCL